MFDTVTTQFVYDAAQRLGLKPEILTPSGFMSVQTEAGERYLFQSQTSINSQFAYWLARNKYATRTVLARHGLQNIPYTRTLDYEEANMFLQKHGKIIIKPNEGSHSIDVQLVASSHELADVELGGKILEKYISGRELRYLVLDGEVLAVHHKDYKEPINNLDTLKRVSLERDQWNSELMAISAQVLAALGMRYGAVDYLVTDEGKPYILEVNAAPGIRRFQQPDQGPAIDLTAILLRTMFHIKEGS